MAGIKDLITQIPPEYRLYLQTMFPGQKTGTIDESYFSQDFKDQLKDQVLSKMEMGMGFESPPAYDHPFFPSGTVRKGTILPQDYRTVANPAGTTDPKYYEGERGGSLTGYSSPFNTLGTYQYEYKMPTAPAFDNAAIVVTDKYDWNPAYGTVPAQNFTGYIDKGFGEKGDEDYVEGSDVDAKMLFEFVKNQIKNKELDTASALELIGNYLGPKESKGEGKDIKITIPVDTPTATIDDRKKADEIRRKDLQKMRGPIGRDNRSVDTSRGAVRGAQQDISNYQDFGEVPLAEGGRVGYALGSPEPLNVSNEEKRIAFDLYQALKDIEEQYTGETIAGDPSPQNLDPSDRRQETLMASGDFPEFENYADVIDAYNSGVAVEPGESLTDYIKRNNIKIKEIEMDPLGDLKKVELVDELEPGPLKDELKEKFDPSQETYEEYLRRINLDRPFNAADGGRAKFQDGLSVQTLDPLFPTQDPTSTDFKPLDLPGAIIPPLAIGAGAKRLKDIFLSKDEGDDKKEIVPSDDKGSNIEPPKGPKFDDLAQDFLVEEAVERLKKKEMDVDKRTDKTLLARDLDLDIPKSGLYDLRKDKNFFNNRLKFLKKKGVNFDGYYSTPEIANLLGIKTGSGVRDFVVRKNVPMVKKGLFNVLTLNDFLKSYNPTRERILEAPDLDVRTKARTDFLSEAGGSIYQKFKDLRVPKNLPEDVKQIYDKYNLTEVEGGHPFPVEFFTKKYGKGNTLQNKRQFDWIYRNKNKLFDKDNLVFQSKDVNTLFRDSINQLKKQYEILSPLVDKYEGKGAVKNKNDIATIEAANNAIMEIIAKSEFDAEKFIKNNPNSVNISRMKEGGLHGALFNTDTGKVSLYTGAGEGAGFVKGAASEDKLDSKLKLAGDYVDIISKVITDEDDKKMFENYINEKILPRFQKGGIVSLMA